jgi:hypothetical protein
VDLETFVEEPLGSAAQYQPTTMRSSAQRSTVNQASAVDVGRASTAPLAQRVHGSVHVVTLCCRGTSST